MILYLDMDGVLNEFLQPFLDHNMIQMNSEKHWPVGVWGMSHLKPRPSWDLPPEFWATLPKTSWFYDLIMTACSLVGKHNVVIATSPANGASAAGKLQWLKTHMTWWYEHKYFILLHRKELLANENTILLDDSDSNVEAFRNHGGKAVLLPRRWNSRHDIDPLDRWGVAANELQQLIAP